MRGKPRVFGGDHSFGGDTLDGHLVVMVEAGVRAGGMGSQPALRARVEALYLIVARQAGILIENDWFDMQGEPSTE